MREVERVEAVVSELRELNEQVAEFMGWQWWSFWRASYLIPPHLVNYFKDHPALGWKPERLQETGNFADTFTDYSHCKLPDFVGEIAAAFQVQDRIKELGLEEEYGERLSEEIQRQSNGKHGVFYGSEVFDIAHASAELRCRVALECVKEKAKAVGG